MNKLSKIIKTTIKEAIILIIIINCPIVSSLHMVICTVVSHIYTYDRAQNILNFVQPLQNLIL